MVLLRASPGILRKERKMGKWWNNAGYLFFIINSFLFFLKNVVHILFSIYCVWLFVSCASTILTFPPLSFYFSLFSTHSLQMHKTYQKSEIAMTKKKIHRQREYEVNTLDQRHTNIFQIPLFPSAMVHHRKRYFFVKRLSILRKS